MKRTISMLLVCVLVFSCMPVYASAQTTDEISTVKETVSVAGMSEAEVSAETVAAEKSSVPSNFLLQDKDLVQKIQSVCQSSPEPPKNKPVLLPSDAVAQDVGDHNYFEVEPNDTIEQAYPVYSDSTISANLTVYDLDYYKYTLKAYSSIEFLIASTKNTLMIAFLDEFGEITDAFAVDYLDADGLYYAYITGEEIAGTHHIVFVDENLSYVEYAFYAYFKEVPCDHATYTTKVTAPTCTAQGYTTYTCSSCGYEWKDNYTPMKDHSYNEVVTKPTCISKGYTTYTCKVCGYDYRDNYTKMTDHDWNSGTVIQEPFGGNPGQKLFACNTIGCNKTEIREFYYADVVRIAGASRYLTAIDAADELKTILGIAKFDSILIASGTNFADALAGSYLAAVKDAPILLSTKKSDGDNLKYIQENLSSSGTVYILGGTGAVSDSIENLLKASGIQVKRLAGDNRYATNLLILEEAGFSGGEVLVAIGNNFADSLSASATGKPILLVAPKWNTISDDYVAYLSGKECTFTIIGGTGAVGESIENDLKNYGSVRRISGSNRLQTSVKVAETYFGTPTDAVLACSTNFPDGLCGGPVAYALGAPLLLVNVNKEATPAAYVSARNIKSGYVMGGTGVVSDDSARTVFGLASNYELMK